MKEINRPLALLFLLISLGCSKDEAPVVVPIDRSANLLATGDSATDFLTNTEFDALRVQIAYVQGFRPREATLDDIREFLLARTYKTDISYEFLPLPATGEESLSLTEIANLENENRTLYNEGSALGLYIFFADAPADADMEEGENIVTLGAVYRNTSMVVHATTIREVASLSNLLEVADVETATIGHELGHLFGLVDLGTPEVNPHEDPEAPNHCNEADCLMQAKLEFGGGMAKMLENRTAKGLAAVPSLGPECILDLVNAGGRPIN
ncbi:hypothetical protein H7F20_10110 [Robiginitalea sp. SC105]|nr:hypothetical protein [Robiginitalea sp. SC105]